MRHSITEASRNRLCTIQSSPVRFFTSPPTLSEITEASRNRLCTIQEDVPIISATASRTIAFPQSHGCNRILLLVCPTTPQPRSSPKPVWQQHAFFGLQQLSHILRLAWLQLALGTMRCVHASVHGTELWRWKSLLGWLQLAPWLAAFFHRSNRKQPN